MNKKYFLALPIILNLVICKPLYANDNSSLTQGSPETCDIFCDMATFGRSIRQFFQNNPGSFGKIMSGLLGSGVASGGIWFGLSQNKEPNTNAQSVYYGTLSNLSEVMNKAALVMNKAESELWIAVDIPAFGAGSSSKDHKKYHAELTAARSRDGLTRKLLWFDSNFEKALISSPFFSSLHSAGGQGKVRYDAATILLRSDLNDVTPRNNIALIWHNFWVSKNADGYQVVIAWSLPNQTNSEVVGLYTTSPEVGEALKDVWNNWADANQHQTVDQLNISIKQAL